MATKWKIDPTHSEIQFKVKHLMISTVTGHFKTFDLEVETETDDVQTPKRIVFTADIESITTNNAQRDAHLKSSDFFHAEDTLNCGLMVKNMNSMKIPQGYTAI